MVRNCPKWNRRIKALSMGLYIAESIMELPTDALFLPRLLGRCILVFRTEKGKIV